MTNDIEQTSPELYPIEMGATTSVPLRPDYENYLNKNLEIGGVPLLVSMEKQAFGPR
jgi:hypothetical protein